jgi:hypothetical protein
MSDVVNMGAAVVSGTVAAPVAVVVQDVTKAVDAVKVDAAQIGASAPADVQVAESWLSRNRVLVAVVVVAVIVGGIAAWAL